VPTQFCAGLRVDAPPLEILRWPCAQIIWRIATQQPRNCRRGVWRTIRATSDETSGYLPRNCRATAAVASGALSTQHPAKQPDNCRASFRQQPSNVHAVAGQHPGSVPVFPHDSQARALARNFPRLFHVPSTVTLFPEFFRGYSRMTSIWLLVEYC
jgi:hypothetical protein